MPLEMLPKTLEGEIGALSKPQALISENSSPEKVSSTPKPETSNKMLPTSMEDETSTFTLETILARTITTQPPKNPTTQVSLSVKCTPKNLEPLSSPPLILSKVDVHPTLPCAAGTMIVNTLTTTETATPRIAPTKTLETTPTCAGLSSMEKSSLTLDPTPRSNCTATVLRGVTTNPVST